MLLEGITHAIAVLVARSHHGDRGASLVEYALLVALIAVVCIAAVEYFGGSTGDSLSRSGSTIFTD